MAEPTALAESAFASLVTALALTGTRGTQPVSVSVLTGLDDESKVVPRVGCGIDGGGEEVVKATGIFRNAGRIEIVTNLTDETLAIHQARVNSVTDALQIDTIADSLNAAVADYHCYEVAWLAPENIVANGQAITLHPFSIVHCGSTIT